MNKIISLLYYHTTIIIVYIRTMDHIHNSWKPLFEEYKIRDMDLNYSTSTCFPPKEEIFRIFEMDVRDIQIVLLGQDPYHRPGQAHGLSFSVPSTMKIPPSLTNIFKELKREFPQRQYSFTHGNLENWFKREKIFLLNSALTLEEGKPGSHLKTWERFTDAVIQFISSVNKKCIFLLFGNFAKKKEIFIEDKTRIVSCCHPSPLARGFVGSNVFSKVEAVLQKQVDWSL